MKLEQIAFLGRTYREYLDMFALDEDALKGENILDCPAGPSSFAAEAHAKGLKVTASDPCYSLTTEAIAKKIQDDRARVFDALDAVSDNYRWNYYESKDEIISLRKEASELFLEDFEPGLEDERYVDAALSQLPFADNEFTMALSGHFLFLYEQWISIDIHLQYIRELLRVSSREVRIYPLVTLDATAYDYLGYIITTLEDEGVKAEIDPVRLEFLKGSGKMLKLTHS